MKYLILSIVLCGLIALSFIGGASSPAYPAPGDYYTSTPTSIYSPTPRCGNDGRMCTAEPRETQNAHLTETQAVWQTHIAQLTNAPTRTPRTPIPNATQPPYPGPGDEYGQSGVYYVYLPVVSK